MGKKNIGRMLKGVLITTILSIGITTTVFAGTWQPHEYCEDINTYQGGWEYIENGHAVNGWRLIGNDWYYFDPFDGCMTKDPYCEYINSVNAYACQAIDINNDIYYFNKDGKMLKNCYIVQGSGGFKYWLDNNGHSDYKSYGSKYEGYN